MLTRWWSIWRRLAAVCGVAFFAWLLFQVWPVWLTPGPKTTVITGPLKPNGQVDYLAALNAEASAGVTPENNAVVLLVQALGPGVIDVSVRKRYFELLGVDTLPLELGGPYLRSFDEMFGGDLVRVQRAVDQMELARKKPWAADEYPDLAAWLAANEQPLQLCAQACERERYYDPLVAGGSGTLVEVLLPLVQQSRNFSRLLGVRAMAHVQAGRIDEALTDATTSHRLSRLLAQHHFLIPHLVGYALSATASHTDECILRSIALTREQARAQREFRSALPSFPEIFGIIDHSERYSLLDATQHTLLGPTFHVGWLQPNRLLERVNERIDEQVAVLKISDPADRREAIHNHFLKLRESTRPTGMNACQLVAMPRRQIIRAAADVMVGMYSPAGEQALAAQQRERQRQTLNILGFALAEYRAVHGRLPETLEALVPEILDHVSLDTFSETPLKYVVDGKQGTFLIYSVGENGVDDQGRFDSQIKADDISFGTMPEE